MRKIVRKLIGEADDNSDIDRFMSGYSDDTVRDHYGSLHKALEDGDPEAILKQFRKVEKGSDFRIYGVIALELATMMRDLLSVHKPDAQQPSAAVDEMHRIFTSNTSAISGRNGLTVYLDLAALRNSCRIGSIAYSACEAIGFALAVVILIASSEPSYTAIEYNLSLTIDKAGMALVSRHAVLKVLKRLIKSYVSMAKKKPH